MSNINIEDRPIGPGHPPYVIAELSANHNGDLDQALRIIDAAQEAGADAVKIQTYRPDTITLKSDAPDFQITEGLWAGRTLYDLYEWAHTPWEWHEALFAHAAKRGITLFSSPFDPTAADLLQDLGAPAFKIASFSLEPAEFAALCEGARTAWEAVGSVDYGRKSSEQANVKFRRSLYFVKDMELGEVVDEGSVRSVRPGFGITPKNFDKLIGRRLLKSVKAATSVQWEDLE